MWPGVIHSCGLSHRRYSNRSIRMGNRHLIVYYGLDKSVAENFRQGAAEGLIYASKHVFPFGRVNKSQAFRLPASTAFIRCKSLRSSIQVEFFYPYGHGPFPAIMPTPKKLMD